MKSIQNEKDKPFSLEPLSGEDFDNSYEWNELEMARYAAKQGMIRNPELIVLRDKKIKRIAQAVDDLKTGASAEARSEGFKNRILSLGHACVEAHKKLRDYKDERIAFVTAARQFSITVKPKEGDVLKVLHDERAGCYSDREATVRDVTDKESFTGRLGELSDESRELVLFEEGKGNSGNFIRLYFSPSDRGLNTSCVITDVRPITAASELSTSTSNPAVT